MSSWLSKLHPKFPHTKFVLSCPIYDMRMQVFFNDPERYQNQSEIT